MIMLHQQPIKIPHMTITRQSKSEIYTQYLLNWQKLLSECSFSIDNRLLKVQTFISFQNTLICELETIWSLFKATINRFPSIPIVSQPILVVNLTTPGGTTLQAIQLCTNSAQLWPTVFKLCVNCAKKHSWTELVHSYAFF